MELKKDMDNLDLILLLQENRPDEVAEVLKRINGWENLTISLRKQIEKSRILIKANKK